MSLLQDLQKLQTQNVRKIEIAELTVTSIIPLSTDKCPKDKEGNVIPKSMVITKEVGTIFCFDNSIINRPESLAFGAQAQVSLEKVSYKDKEGKDAETININRVEFMADDDTFRAAARYGVSIAKPAKAH